MADAGQRRGPPGRGDLTQGRIGTTLLKFALPTLACSILQSLNGTVNAIWVGRFLGEDALAATSNANMVMFLLTAFVVRLRHGLDHPDRPGVGPQGRRRGAARSSAPRPASFALIAILIAIARLFPVPGDPQPARNAGATRRRSRSPICA